MTTNNLPNFTQELVFPKRGHRSVANKLLKAFHHVTAGLALENNILIAPSAAGEDNLISSQRSEAILAALNGVLGDYLAAFQHPFAIPMHMRLSGAPLSLDSASLRQQLSSPSDKLMVLVHGLCMNDLQWANNLSMLNLEDSFSEKIIQSNLYLPICLNYNSGRHISTNGREFTLMLETLVNQWPVPVREIVIVAYSMGGLVTRSACHYAALSQHKWLKHLSKLFFIATPHHGSPLERYGNLVDIALSSNRLTEPLARIGKIRSAGITDLRYGNILDSDWQGRNRFAKHGDQRDTPYLPKGVPYYAIAGSTGSRSGDLADRLLGDGLVPVSSALGQHSNPERDLQINKARQWVTYRMHHFALLKQPMVYAQIRSWLAQEQVKA